RCHPYKYRRHCHPRKSIQEVRAQDFEGTSSDDSQRAPGDEARSPSEHDQDSELPGLALPGGRSFALFQNSSPGAFHQTQRQRRLRKRLQRFCVALPFLQIVFLHFPNLFSTATFRPSSARCKRLLTVDSGIAAITAISSNFIPVSKRNVSTSRWMA